jgi:phosphoribosylformylglycinamidine cyclo-ligase
MNSAPSERACSYGSAYAKAGVDIAKGDEVVRAIAPVVRETFTPAVLGDIGGFGGLFKLQGYREPVLVASADGVGTKLKLAVLAESYASAGADIVNHSINDIWVQGADPLFFLDYIGTGKLEQDAIVEMVRGMADACHDAGCALIGGETAEMPGIYATGDYDVVGFMVGAVERYELVDGSGIRAGDVLVGFPSSGLHTNGYSLVRQVFELDGSPDAMTAHRGELGMTLGEALLAVHKPYYRALKPVRSMLRGMAHITGGGITGNLPRSLPRAMRAEVRMGSWDVPPLFRLIQETGDLDADEMYRVFNMGIGFIAAVRPSDVDTVAAAGDGSVIGEIFERREGESALSFV